MSKATPPNQAVAPRPAQATLKEVIMSPAMQRQFSVALPKLLSADRFMRCLMTTFNRVPDLLNCDRNSVLAGAMTAAQLGLEIDPALGRAYLLPYRDKNKGMVAQLIIGYKGYTDLAYRSGQVSGIQAEVVYAKDKFKYRFGLEPLLEHEPCDDADRGELKYVWVVVSLANGGKVWRVLNRTEVMRHKSFSRGSDSQYSPWNTAEAEMWRKTAIRSVASIIPLSPELRDAVAAEESEAIALDLGAVAPVAQAVYVEPETTPAPEGLEGMAGAAETSEKEKK